MYRHTIHLYWGKVFLVDPDIRVHKFELCVLRSEDTWMLSHTSSCCLTFIPYTCQALSLALTRGRNGAYDTCIVTYMALPTACIDYTYVSLTIVYIIYWMDSSSLTRCWLIIWWLIHTQLFYLRFEKPKFRVAFLKYFFFLHHYKYFGPILSYNENICHKITYNFCSLIQKKFIINPENFIRRSGRKIEWTGKNFFLYSLVIHKLVNFVWEQ